MSALAIILLVCFIVVMILLAAGNAGAVQLGPNGASWLVFVALLILGLAVFLFYGGVIVVERTVAVPVR